MKKGHKVLFWVLGIFLVIFFAFNILIGALAPKIIQQQIQDNLKLKTNLEKVSLSLPFTIILEKLEIGDLASFKRISFSPNLVALLFGKVVIHGLTITEPVINLERSPEGKFNLPVLEQKGKPPAIYLTSFNLRDGKINFKDKKIAIGGFQVSLDKLNIKVAKVIFPLTSLATNFDLSGQLLGRQNGPCGKITLSGRLDYLAKDLDAVLEVKGLDLTEFSVYYGNFISKRKLSSASLDLVSTFKSRNNLLHIANKFNLSNLVYAENQSEEVDLDFTKNALDLFTDAKGNLSLEFDIDTLLDKPALSRKKIKTLILKMAAKNLAQQSPQDLVSKVSAIINQYGGKDKGIKNILGE
jgi:hypothetical protein